MIGTSDFKAMTTGHADDRETATPIATANDDCLLAGVVPTTQP
jgi:hypothetical protein